MTPAVLVQRILDMPDVRPEAVERGRALAGAGCPPEAIDALARFFASTWPYGRQRSRP